MNVVATHHGTGMNFSGSLDGPTDPRAQHCRCLSHPPEPDQGPKDGLALGTMRQAQSPFVLTPMTLLLVSAMIKMVLKYRMEQHRQPQNVVLCLGLVVESRCTPSMRSRFTLWRRYRRLRKEESVGH